MHINAFAATDVGKHRDRNEDAFLIDKELNLFVVCDGMGGHAAGDVASRKTTEFLAEHLRDYESEFRTAHATPGGYFRVVELAEAATLATCQQLHELASSQPEFAGMGTTMTTLIVVDNKGIMSHVGDSRLYLLRDGELHLLSSDHTLANELFRRGALDENGFEASSFRHVLTRSVGSVKGAEPDMLLFDILPDDTFLLCSDGLSNYVEDFGELVSFLERDDLSATPGELVDLANGRGGRDNITAIVVRATADSTADSTEDRETEQTRLKTDAMKSTFLCEGISYSRLIRLVEISELRTYDVGTRVLDESHPCEGLYLIVDGRLAVSRHGDAATELTRGDCFCETALVRERKARATVETVEPTTLLVLPRAGFQRLTRRFPKIGRALHARLLDRLARQVDDTMAVV